MNRALVCTLTVAIAVIASSAMADVGLSLNLRYTDPANEAAGGTWELAVLSTAGEDVVGVSAILTGIDDPTGVITNPANDGETVVDDPNNVGFAPVFSAGGGVYQVGYVQDNTAGLTAGVGTGGLADVLTNTNWDGSDIVITGGTFGATRPSFTTAGINTTEVNVGTGPNPTVATFATIDGVLSPTVRGDGVATDSLPMGDYNRDGVVDLFNDVLIAYNGQCVGCNPGWDGGDSNSDGDVDLFNDVLAAYNNQGVSFPPWPPAIGAAAGAVPEPTTLGLLSFALVGLAARRRR